MSGIIHLEDIRKDYIMGKHQLQVLKGLSRDIFKNEYVALMGPSGSGKSTLMNILGCLDTPTGGRYILNNQDVSKMQDNDLAEVRNKEIGFVFQQFNLLPRLTALENVALPLVYGGMAKKQRMEKAMHVLKMVNLTDRSHHRGIKTDAVFHLVFGHCGAHNINTGRKDISQRNQAITHSVSRYGSGPPHH